MAKGKWTEDYFAKRLRTERERGDMTQEELANLLEAKGIAMHWTTIAKIEKGKRSVRIDEAAAIADVFGTSVDALLGRKSGVENDLAYMLHSALHTAGNAAVQVATMAGELQDRFQDIEGLDFEGREQVTADMQRAWTALNEANESLWRLRAFELPEGAAVSMREALLQRAVREMPIGAKLEMLTGEDQE